MSDDNLVCWKCGVSLADIPRPLSRYQPCRQCGADLYVCRLCTHYDARFANTCREERAEPPLNKETANFCDWFTPKSGAFEATTGKEKAAREAVEALFGGATPTDNQDSPPTALEELFKSKE